MPTPFSTPHSSKEKAYDSEQRHANARNYSESPRRASDREEEYVRSRSRRHEAESTYRSPTIRSSYETPSSKPGSSSSGRDVPKPSRESKPNASDAPISFGKARNKLTAVSRFRFLGRKIGKEIETGDVNNGIRSTGGRGKEKGLLVSPPSTTYSDVPITAEQRYERPSPSHTRFYSTPNVGTYDSGDQHERRPAGRKPPPQVLQKPWPVLVPTANVRLPVPTSNMRPDVDNKDRQLEDESNQNQFRSSLPSSSPPSASRAEDISRSPSVTSRMGRFGIYASPSPSVVGNPVSSPTPHQRWMPASPRPLHTGKVASPAPPTSPLRSPLKPPMHSLAAALTKTPKTPQGRSLSDDHDRIAVAGCSRNEPEAQTSLKAFPTPRTRRRPLKEEELFAMKLANRMSAFIPQTPHPTASSRLSFENDLTTIIDLSGDGDHGEGDDDVEGSGTEEDATPKAAGQGKDLPANQFDASQAEVGSSGTEAKSEAQSQTQTTLSAFLSSARVMNDNFVKSTSSAWDKLFYRGASGAAKDKGKGKESDASTPKAFSANTSSLPAPTPEEVFNKASAKDDLEGSRDIMLYSPLIPASNSIVELGQSEVVTLYSQSGDEEREREDRAYRAELRRRWADGRGFVSFEALAREEKSAAREGRDDDGGMVRERARTMSNALQIDLGNDVESSSSSETLVDKESTTESPSPAPAPMPRERVVWRPSPTQLSVQVLWWGYRMYLPPPVLATLNSHSTSITKRAALLTSALTWLLNNLPLDLLPPILAPAALLLRALVPLLGAIGTFISWSWRAIVMFDRGNGVVLSATWLLPVVLVPGTWDEIVEDTATAGVGDDARREPPVHYTTGGVQTFTTAVPRAGPSGLRTRRDNTL